MQTTKNNFTKSKLETAVIVVNKRYASGLNDDDQVYNMMRIANGLKGWHVWSDYNTYKVVSDLDALKGLIDRYGYWSEEVKRFNTVLTNKGGHDYMTKLNLEVKPQ